MGFDFDAAVTAPFRMQPGLRRMAPGTPHLTASVVPHRGAARHLREKLAVLACFADEALLCEPGFDAAPALATLARQAATEHPQALQIEHDLWRAPWLGWQVGGVGGGAGGGAGQVQAIGQDWPEVGAVLRQLPAHWRQAALLCLAFSEDFAIVDASSGRIPWMAVALPSSWVPREKIGRHFTEVHAPVADNALLLQASEHLLRLVTGEQRWERFVWTVTPHARLHAHPLRIQRWADNPEALSSPGHCAALACFRSERQTFIPVPGTTQALFTIAVQVQPLAIAVHTPQRARQVFNALSTMSAEVLAYRGLTEVRQALLGWLEQRAEGMA